MKLAFHPGIMAIGLGYIMAVALLYVRGEGLTAAYLTMPPWFVVAGLGVLVTLVTPDAILDATLFSWAGNLVALVVSAATNIAGVCFVVRRSLDKS